ncbi:MAG: ATP-grasp domain-containing protein, partial [Spirochaetales bacterium]
GIPGPRAALWERVLPGDERVLPGDERALPGVERGASAAYQGESASHGPLPRGMTYPVVQKLRRGGYDGRGVAVLRDEHGTRLPGESLVEEFVPVEKEVSVLVARSASGREAVYPPVLMEFDSEANINTLCALPSGLSPRLADTASEVAARAVRSLDIVGICAVELFITDEGRVLVNELAPRPHNSGHLTLEASATSQFEQHLRAILDLPLGSTDTVRPAVMVNLLGSGEVGRPAIEGLDSVLALPEAHLHLYDKRPSKPGRKMGHITVCGETIERARERADVVRRAVAIVGVQTAHE